MIRIHLAECEPEQEHPEWTLTTFGEATDHGNLEANMCSDTEYMATELYPHEEVWVEQC
jgi:hypothetical protein